MTSAAREEAAGCPGSKVEGAAVQRKKRVVKEVGLSEAAPAGCRWKCRRGNRRRGGQQCTD
jgi:hypothetical protein